MKKLSFLIFFITCYFSSIGQVIQPPSGTGATNSVHWFRGMIKADSGLYVSMADTSGFFSYKPSFVINSLDSLFYFWNGDYYEKVIAISDTSTYTPATRTISINGIRRDLSIDRSWHFATLYANSGTLSDNRIVAGADFSLGFLGTRYVTVTDKPGMVSQDNGFNINYGLFGGEYSTASLRTNLITDSVKTFEFANKSGTIPLSVNGISANSLGEITIPTGTGTVSSVGLTGSGALSFSPSSITTAGTFTSSWSGTASQYIRGNGSLATFPSIPSVNDGTLTLGTSGIATGSQSFTANSATNKTFTVNVPGTNLSSSLSGTTLTIGSSTGTNSAVNLNSLIPATPSLQSVTAVGALTDKRIVILDQGVEKQSTNAATAFSNASTLTIHRPIEYSTFASMTGIPYIKLPTNNISNSNGIVIKGRIRRMSGSGTLWLSTDFEITVHGTENTSSIATVLLSNHGSDGMLPIRLIYNGPDVRITFGNSSTYVGLQLIIFDYVGRNGEMPNAFGSGLMPNTAGYVILERPSNAISYAANELWVTDNFQYKALQKYFSTVAWSIPANSRIAVTTQTVTGASIGDGIIITQQDNALHFFGRVTAANTVVVYVTNPTTSTIVANVETMNIRVIK